MNKNKLIIQKVNKNNKALSTFNQLIISYKFQRRVSMSKSLNSGNYLIDQQMEVSQNYLTNNVQINTLNQDEAFNQLIQSRNKVINQAKSQGSYQVILQQSLTTQDKPFLYQILLQIDSVIIRNTLQSLPPKRVIQLLRMIRSILQQHIKLGKGEDHCSSLSKWLQQLIRLHLTTITSNIQNKQTVLSIRKFIKRKTQNIQQMKIIKAHLLSQSKAQELQYLNQIGKEKKNAKFQYIQEQKQQVQEEEKQQESQQIKDEDMEDLQLNQLDIDDFLEDDF